MRYSQMISIDVMTPKHFDDVRKLKVNPDQIPFVGTTKEIIEKINDQVIGNVIYENNILVGCFLLDKSYSRDYDFAPKGALGLRAYLVDHKQQGKGIGTRAVQVIPSFVASHYPEFSSIFLTVNCKNPTAKKCYESGGFIETESLYHGGAAGPQYVMKFVF